MEFFSLLLPIIIFIISILVYFLLLYKNKYKLLLEDNIKISNEVQNRTKQVLIGEMSNNIINQWKQSLISVIAASNSLKMKKEINDLDDKFFFRTLENMNDTIKNIFYASECFKEFLENEDKKESFLLNDILDKAIEIEYIKLVQSKIFIEKDFSENYLLHNSSQALLHSIVNLLVNIRDELINKEHEKLISIKTYLDDGIINIEIKYNSNNIDNQTIDMLFNKKTPNKSLDKANIGLLMTKQLIEKSLHGKISIKNDTYEFNNKSFTATTFLIKLPFL